MRKTIMAILFLTAIAQQASAAMYCTRPRDPDCPMLGKFDSDYEFQSCKSDMESYQVAVNKYAQCLDDEKSSTIKEFNKAVERFNCYARGETMCF
jgi:hypothetical protein